MNTQMQVHRKVRYVGALAVTAAMLAIGSATTVSQGAGLLIADGGLGGLLEVTDHQVRVTIQNGIAVTEVIQVFRNTENRQVEALYTFPVPKGASVSDFSMWIEGKEMVGEVLEKQRAREIYESYKVVRRDPGLLEQTDYKTFEMRIFPIAAGAEQRVRICYYQELDVDHDRATFVYPLATASRPGLTGSQADRLSISFQVRSAVPIAEMTSPSHGGDFVFAQHDESYWQGSLEAAGGDLGRDVVLTYRLARPTTGLDMITSRAKGEDGYFCLMLTAGKELDRSADPMDYVFVLDVSGSMAQGGKLGLSRSSVASFIEELGPGDAVEVITFNVAAKAVFGQLTAADEQAKAKARQFLDSQEARGGTVLRPALEAAYRYARSDRTLNVVVLSDGMAEQGERKALLELVRARPAGSRVFCVGVGNEVDQKLLEQLAEDAGGLAAFLSPEDDLARQAASFRRKLTRPAAENLKVSFEGGRVYETEPAKLPSLYHGAPLRLYGRYRSAGPVKIRVNATVAGRAVEWTGQFTLPPSDDANPQIERMWAWHRVQALLKEADRSGSRQSAETEIIRLGEAYSIATEFTSFIVLENDGEYQRWKIDRKNALRLDRDHQAQAKLQEQLESLRQASANRLGPKRVEVGTAEPALASAAPGSAAGAPSPAIQPSAGPSFRGSGGGPVGFIGAGVIVALGAASLRKRKGKAAGKRPESPS